MVKVPEGVTAMSGLWCCQLILVQDPSMLLRKLTQLPHGPQVDRKGKDNHI